MSADAVTIQSWADRVARRKNLTAEIAEIAERTERTDVRSVHPLCELCGLCGEILFCNSPSN